MQADLSTTNLLLGVMAVVSVLEALALIGFGVAGWMMYRQVTELINGLERQHVLPLRARVDAILDDVKSVTGKMKDRTDRVDHAIEVTIDRVDETAERLQASLRAKTIRVVGFVRAMRAVVEQVLRSRPERAGRTPRAAAVLESRSAAGRV